MADRKPYQLVSREWKSEDTIFNVNGTIIGKDLLMIADQANNFICISSDVYDRVTDNYVWINKNEIFNNIEDELNNLLSILKDIILYIKTQGELLISKTTVNDIEIILSYDGMSFLYFSLILFCVSFNLIKSNIVSLWSLKYLSYLKYPTTLTLLY